MEAMTAIRPRKPPVPGSCAAIAASAGKAVFSAPVTLVSKMARAWSAGSVEPPVPAEMPALAKTRSSRPAPAIQPAMASRSRTSTTCGRASAPAAAQAAAVAASRPASRPPRCSVTPGRAQASASARPMPDDAPVTSTCRQGQLGVAIACIRSPKAGQPAPWAPL